MDALVGKGQLQYTQLSDREAAVIFCTKVLSACITFW